LWKRRIWPGRLSAFISLAAVTSGHPHSNN